MTEGANGGSYVTADGRRERYEAVRPPGPVVDTYGAGDSFVAGTRLRVGSQDGAPASHDVRGAVRRGRRHGQGAVRGPADDRRAGWSLT